MNFATYINETQGGFAKRAWAIAITAPEDGATWKKGQDYYYAGYDHANHIPILMDKPSKKHVWAKEENAKQYLKWAAGITKGSVGIGGPITADWKERVEEVDVDEVNVNVDEEVEVNVSDCENQTTDRS